VTSCIISRKRYTHTHIYYQSKDLKGYVSTVRKTALWSHF